LNLTSTPEDDVYKTQIDMAKAEQQLAAAEARNSVQRAKMYEQLGNV
jgi:hypothetical protein